MNMKQVAIARIFVGYKLTEMALTMEAHKPQLANVVNAITIKLKSVKKFNATEQMAETTNQTAENTKEKKREIL